ncbi:MAG TPA: HyaD/HybD family hydrogenase maturation endopeptidase [Gallionella sp.]|nr:HyaD/HybD family hydrogenase maturation endopeptidase [Gallionella sp.]
MNIFEEKILVLGIGNLLCADEGFGVRAVQAMHSQWRFPQQVSLMDGGVKGLSLLYHVQEAHRMIVFDAIDFGLPPGTLKVLSNDQVPKFMGVKKLSLHQTGFQEVLAVAELIGGLPPELLLIGVQPVDMDDYGGSLRGEIKAQIQPALEIALGYLKSCGIEPEPRSNDADALEPLLHASLDIDVYETGRAFAAQATPGANPGFQAG